jgi:hypothetical protein
LVANLRPGAPRVCSGLGVGSAPIDLDRPGSVRIGVGLPVETRDQLRSQLRAFPRRELERFSKEFLSSITSSESEEVTNGFFDVSDRPPWDTWMFCTQRKTRGSTWSGDPLDLLIGWVPSSLVASVEKGIGVNPYDCIYWATEKDLREWGLAE